MMNVVVSGILGNCGEHRNGGKKSRSCSQAQISG